jgi:hypothetical protein
VLSLLCLAPAILGGAVATYAFDDQAPLWARLAAGVPLGLVLLGLIGLCLASWFGLTPAVAGVAGCLAASPLLILIRESVRRASVDDLRLALRVPLTTVRDARPAALCALVAALILAGILCRVYTRAMMVGAAGVSTGVDHNLGDLPFHLGIVMGFVRGQNFPPEHPELAGVRLSYPFLVDFVTALPVRLGVPLSHAVFVTNLALALALAALLFRLTRLLTGSLLAASLAPWLLFLSGGAGGWLAFKDAAASHLPVGQFLLHLPRNYTILPSGEYRWGNALTTLFVPQRSLLLGLPLALVVITLWWQAVNAEDRRARRLLAGAGCLAGLLPLVHAHSLTVLLATAACLALLFRRWRAWAMFFAAALLLAAPQAAWLMRGASVQLRSFLAWQVGWDRGAQNPAWFWLMNAGLFLPALAVALVWGRRMALRQTIRFSLPFLLWFLIPNLFRLSPWIWDNVKFLIYWQVASIPLLAGLLAWLTRRGWPGRVGGAVLAGGLMLSGGLDVWRVASGAMDYPIFDSNAVAIADAIAAATPPRALVLHAPSYNSPVLLSGRRSLLGYPGHIWSQGLDGGRREEEIRLMYQAGPAGVALLAHYRVGYVLVGPQEYSLGPLNGPWLASLRKLAERGDYALYALPGSS